MHAARKDGAEIDVELSLSNAGPLLVVSIRRLQEESRVPGDERYRLAAGRVAAHLRDWDGARASADLVEELVRA